MKKALAQYDYNQFIFRSYLARHLKVENSFEKAVYCERLKRSRRLKDYVALFLCKAKSHLGFTELGAFDSVEIWHHHDFSECVFRPIIHTWQLCIQNMGV